VDSADEPASSTAKAIAFMIDQSFNVEGKVGAMIHSVVNCQEAYAKALLVPRKALKEAQMAGDVLGAHRIISEAFKTDVRPLLARVREEMGAPPDPLDAYRKSGYEEKIRSGRGTNTAGSNYQ
jgi:L-rhamnose isomerase/sugar isomerase